MGSVQHRMQASDNPPWGVPSMHLGRTSGRHLRPCMGGQVNIRWHVQSACDEHGRQGEHGTRRVGGGVGDQKYVELWKKSSPSQEYVRPVRPDLETGNVYYYYYYYLDTTLDYKRQSAFDNHGYEERAITTCVERYSAGNCTGRGGGPESSPSSERQA